MQPDQLRHAVMAHGPRSDWGNLRVVVPHRGAVRALQQALLPAGAGLLPNIVALADPEPFAADCGLSLPPPANGWPLRAQALRLLVEAHPNLLVGSLIPRTEELLQSLNLLAEYAITPQQLRASVPEELQELWASQGAVLLQLWEASAAQAVQFLPAARRRVVWQGLTKNILAQPPAPTLWWGPAAATPTLQQFQAAVQATDVPYITVSSPCYTLSAATRWEEVQRLTLWVAAQLQQGATRVGVVASGAQAERLAQEIDLRLGVRATTTGGTRWGETAAGAALLHAALRWQHSSKELSMEYWLNQLPIDPRPNALQRVLEELAVLPGRWAGSVAYAWLRQALTALASHAEDALLPDPRVQILPAHAATQQPWDALAIADVVEGVWPAQGAAGGLSQAQRRALGLPDATQQAAHAQGLLHQLQHQGAGQVVFGRSLHDEAGNPLLPSRWWPNHVAPLPERVMPQVWVRPRPNATLGVITPAVPPAKLSPSLLEAILGCPYRAYVGRVLKLEALPPLTYQPDLRERGTLLHAWLAAAARQYAQVAPEQVAEVTEFLRQSARQLVAEIGVLERALWLPKMLKLAPALAQQWAASGASIGAEVWLESSLDELKIHARADALLATANGTTVVDYKTGTPPTKAQIVRGEAPQLAVEAWLLQQAGRPLAGLAYWHLKGYGADPLPVPKTLAPYELIASVAPTLQKVAQQYFQPGSSWPALPDAEGAGIVATGTCARCDFAGVCRRSAVAQQQAAAGAACA